ncbi:MAG: glycosyltransferase [candidate division WOR-3 bacterium]
MNRERRKKVKFIMDMRNYEFNENSNKPTLKDILSKLWTKIALNFSNKYCNGLTFISEELRWTLMKNSQPNPNILIWPSGVDVDFFKNRSIETNKDKFCVFYHGAFTPNRGILESVRAMAIIKNKGVPIIFRLVGGGDIENSVEEVIQKYELDGYVELCGQRKYEEIPELISKSDVCLMAYPNLDYWEVNVPLKLLEYMAMEKVVILTSLEVFEKITKKKKCAIFITDNKPMNIAEGILYAYENRFKLPEWGREGRKIVVSEYSWDNIANNFNRFLSSL